jgi:hypothetical protein
MWLAETTDAHREAGAIDGHAGANLDAGHAAAGKLNANASEIFLLVYLYHIPLPLHNT